MSIRDVKYIQLITRVHYQNNSQKAMQIHYHMEMSITKIILFLHNLTIFGKQVVLPLVNTFQTPLKIWPKNETSSELFIVDLCKLPCYGW